jgi:chromosome segregation ATPase
MKRNSSKDLVVGMATTEPGQPVMAPVILQSLNEFRQRCADIQNDVTEVTNKSTREMELIKADLLAKQARFSLLASKVSEAGHSHSSNSFDSLTLSPIIGSLPSSPGGTGSGILDSLPKSSAQRIAALEDLFRQRTIELDGKSAELAQYQNLLASSNDKIQTLSGRAEDLKQELDELSITREKEVLLLKEAAKMLSIVELDRSELEAKLRDHASSSAIQIADLQDLVMKQANRIKELEDAAANGKSRELSFAEKLDLVGDDVIDKLKDEKAVLLNRIEQLVADSELTQRQFDALNSTLLEKDESISRLENLIKAFNSEKLQTCAHLDKLTEETTTVRVEVSRLWSENQELLLQNGRLTTDLSVVQNNLDRIVQQNALLTTSLAGLQASLEESLMQHQNDSDGHVDTIAKLEQEIDALKSFSILQETQLKTEISELKEELSIMASQKGGMHESLLSVKEEILREASHHLKQRDEWQQRAYMLSQEKTDITQQLEAYKVSSDKEASQLRRKITSLEEQVQEMNVVAERSSAMSQSLATVTAERDELLIQLAAIRAQHENLEARYLQETSNLQSQVLKLRNTKDEFEVNAVAETICRWRRNCKKGRRRNRLRTPLDLLRNPQLPRKPPPVESARRASSSKWRVYLTENRNQLLQARSPILSLCLKHKRM